MGLPVNNLPLPPELRRIIYTYAANRDPENPNRPETITIFVDQRAQFDRQTPHRAIRYNFSCIRIGRPPQATFINSESYRIHTQRYPDILQLRQPAGSTQPGQVIRFNAAIDTIRISSSSLFMLRDFCSPHPDLVPGMTHAIPGANEFNEGPTAAERRARLIGFNLIQNLDVFEIASLNTRGINWLRANILRGLVQLNNVAPNLQPGMNNDADTLTRNRVYAELAALRSLAGPEGPLEDVAGVLLKWIGEMRLTRRLAILFFFS